VSGGAAGWNLNQAADEQSNGAIHVIDTVVFAELTMVARLRFGIGQHTALSLPA
jgi:hypothetical protein